MKKENGRFGIFELLLEIIGWFRIMLSPTLAGIIIGALIYFNVEHKIGKLLGILMGIVGIIIGIVWATKVFKSEKGTIAFLSRTMATPELDKTQEEL